MDFNSNVGLDSSQVTSAGGGGGRGGGIALGGGLGLIITILGLLFGFNPSQILGSGDATTTTSQTQQTNECNNTADIQTNRECRWTAYVNSIQSYWNTQFQQGVYKPAQTITFSGQVNTACGTATSEVGPFYCPGDQKVYVDTGFVNQLLQQLGAKGGNAAEAYIVAHEYGHHIQNLTGVMKQAQSSDETGPTSPQVRLELQADCYAGVWFKNATQDQSGIITNVTQDDLNRVIDAARAVGDDRIQEASSGRVQPESWTHGSAKMRQHWAGVGFQSGNPASCDTFNTNDLGQ